MQPQSSGSDIRTRLRQWQELNLHEEEEFHLQPAFGPDLDPSDIVNSTSRIPEHTPGLRSSETEADEEQQAEAHFMSHNVNDVDNTFDSRPLRMGDLVEIERLLEDRESSIAIYIRRYNNTYSQVLSITGRWIMVRDRFIPFSIPGWVSPTLIEPIIAHLPDAGEIKARDMMNDAIDDMVSVPRDISAPLVSRMVEFWSESREIYRKNASRLDNAHDELAHQSDLRYASLLDVARRLLNKPEPVKVPAVALFAVRSALAVTDFAFNIDRRSHRLTGYLQIRSKDQVKMVTDVRNWIRDWQEDKAKRAALRHSGIPMAQRTYKTPRTAQYVYSFVEKAKKIIEQSRKDRQPTTSGFISPSKKRFPITPAQDSVSVTRDEQFTNEDSMIIRFMEGWNCTLLFQGLPRLLALPPLILHATGMYQPRDFTSAEVHPTGWQFLQEIGVITPYENRVRSDEHLLLPSSQHSKPIEQLVTQVLEMQHGPDFSDSMKDLRHDWGELPVYCIDMASAQEIDDGFSVERVGANAWWVHVHVANPTAFMDRQHKIAKMAKHMGESLYMPERTYAMLPRWATHHYFSLGNGRPCLTFSMKMNLEGSIIDHKIRPGKIRNAIRLTYDEAQDILGVDKTQTLPVHTLTVGGEPPPAKTRKSRVSDLSLEQRQDLKTLDMLARKREAHRAAKGGLVFGTEQIDVQVWQNYTKSGLNWDMPYRKGSRTTEGDPVIQMRTRGFTTYFDKKVNYATQLVQEMMLAAGETAGAWCAERQIPALFRGTLRRHDTPDPEVFLREVLGPVTEKLGQRPIHLNFEYLRMMGSGVMRARPIKHQILGMETYCKTTSPLRRYGDMIMHWQIEAALREEARIGKSLKTDDPNADRRFLPFSAGLETIMLGLAPREAMISRSKLYANRFWVHMLLFRAMHYDECALPFATPLHPDKPKMRVYVCGDPGARVSVPVVDMDLGVDGHMVMPHDCGLEMARTGDIWEAEAQQVLVHKRVILCRPIRLLERPDDGRG